MCSSQERLIDSPALPAASDSQQRSEVSVWTNPALRCRVACERFKGRGSASANAFLAALLRL